MIDRSADRPFDVTVKKCSDLVGIARSIGFAEGVDYGTRD